MNDVVARTRDALIRAWRVHAEASGSDIVEDDALFTCFTGAPRAMYNPTIALRDGFAEALDAREAEFDRRGIPFGFLAFESFADEAADAAERRGMIPNDPSPSMVLSPIPAFERPAGVHLVRDEATLEQHVRVQAEGFEERFEDLMIFSPPSVLRSPERSYLVLSDGEPVATSVLVITGAEAGIFGVSTHPAHRRRGFGRAATVAALCDAAAAGCEVAYLTASPMGYPVYEGLGFRTVEMHRTFGRRTGDPPA